MRGTREKHNHIMRRKNLNRTHGWLSTTVSSVIPSTTVNLIWRQILTRFPSKWFPLVGPINLWPISQCDTVYMRHRNVIKLFTLLEAALPLQHFPPKRNISILIIYHHRHLVKVTPSFKQARTTLPLTVSTHHDWACGLFALGKG